MGLTTSLDFWLTTLLNQFARRSWAFDQAVAFLSVNHLLKGGVLMAVLWWAWFVRPDARGGDSPRVRVLVTLASCMVAMAIVRLLLKVLPFRDRPLHEESLSFVLPHGVATGALDGLSSFPSDHATLFFALATGLFFVSVRLGAAALAYVSLAIALPRIYLGLHYLSDIAVGALIGVVVTLAGHRLLAQRPWMQRVAGTADTHPQYFYPLMFLLTYQIADLFEPVRDLLGGLAKLVKVF